MAPGIDVGPSSTFIQKKVAAQVQPLQLCVGAVVFTLFVLICFIFGLSYETDSMYMLEHDLEQANSTASRLGSAHDSLERRLKSTQRSLGHTLKHRDSELNQLKEKAEKCELSLKMCKQKIKEEAFEIEDEKEMENQLEKDISHRMMKMSKQKQKLDRLIKESSAANSTVKRLHEELFQVKQTHKDEISRLEEQQKSIKNRHGSAIFSLRMDLKRKMAQKQWIRIYVAVLVCLWILPMGAYLMVDSGRWSSLRLSAKRFMEP
eukprot:gnl/MRDRNA2_/MRDRNA2_97378_c0_seq1.p1 gnl/MRDRNA2_/MRDRNA2_97378_c0~~gnl/MRDRNA2_/MRDRNA2_97378_c0_seq1.p1  ORF type:complete len:262 (-),score=66.28 gnl/MRDRNA2_/MRDRNA2_97378_c0_seq1:129-914(-)